MTGRRLSRCGPVAAAIGMGASSCHEGLRLQPLLGEDDLPASLSYPIKMGALRRSYQRKEPWETVNRAEFLAFALLSPLNSTFLLSPPWSPPMRVTIMWASLPQHMGACGVPRMFHMNRTEFPAYSVEYLLGFRY